MGGFFEAVVVVNECKKVVNRRCGLGWAVTLPKKGSNKRKHEDLWPHHPLFLISLSSFAPTGVFESNQQMW